ncbi:MAG: hypothetical protein ACO3F0_00160 [Ilumatobacteraceae bacterium]
MRSPRIIVAMLCLATFTGGCATEVIELDVSPTTLPPQEAAAVTADLSQATLEDLTVVLQDEIGALSRAVFDDDRDEARVHLDRINEAWSFAEPLIVAQFGELADQLTYDLRRVVELARSAVDRNRPADADKATSFLRLALESLEA